MHLFLQAMLLSLDPNTIRPLMDDFSSLKALANTYLPLILMMVTLLLSLTMIDKEMFLKNPSLLLTDMTMSH